MHRASAIALALTYLACAGREPVAVPPETRSVPNLPNYGLTPRAPAASASAAPVSSVSRPSLERVAPQAPPEPPPQVEIKFPILEQSIPLVKARDYKVRLKVVGWPVTRTGSGVEVMLDDFAARRLAGSETLALKDLVPEGAELAEGDHVLVALAIRENGEIVRAKTPHSRAPFAAVHFWIGPRGPVTGADGPAIVYNRPRGTFNGAAESDAVLVDFLLLNAELEKGGKKVRVSVQDAGAGAPRLGEAVIHELDSWQPLLVRGLASGDWRVELSLLGNNAEKLGGARGSASRVISVNRDAPVRR